MTLTQDADPKSKAGFKRCPEHKHAWHPFRAHEPVSCAAWQHSLKQKSPSGQACCLLAALGRGSLGLGLAFGRFGRGCEPAGSSDCIARPVQNFSCFLHCSFHCLLIVALHCLWSRHCLPEGSLCAPKWHANAHWPLPWPKAESNTAQDLTKARPAPSSPCLLPAVGDARAAARSCLLQSGASGSTAHMHTYAHNVGSESQNRFERQCHARVWAKGAMDELLSLSFHDLRSRSQESIMRSLPCASCFGVRGCCSFFGFLLGFGALVWSPRLAPEKMSEPRSSRASSEP